MSVESARFRKPVIPGDRLEIKVKKGKRVAASGNLTAKPMSKHPSSRVQLTAMIVDK